MADEGIIRNRLKIRASIKNSRIFRNIQEEYGGFAAFIWGWTGGEIIYAYLKVVGVINAHSDDCWLYTNPV